MDLPIIYHEDYVAPLPPDHRFPMAKFQMLYQMLLADGVADKSQFHAPELFGPESIQLVHDDNYIQAYCNGTLDAKAQRRIGLPWSPALVNRTCTAVAGTVLTAKLALGYGLACNTAGGTHHAFPNYGSGFCIFNDLAIACRVLQKNGLVRQVLIIDLDVHQGDGTAVIFQDDSSVFTFSMHGENNFPFQKEVSDSDIGLKDGTNGEEYLNRLAIELQKLIEKVAPQFIFYQAGVDVLAQDTMGRLKLTSDDCKQRDRLVFEACKKHQIPVQVSMGGGYSKRIADIVDAHCNTFKEGIQVIL